MKIYCMSDIHGCLISFKQSLDIGTSEISGNRYFHGIYHDGYSHYYIDGTILDWGTIPALMLDTDTDEYYEVIKSGNALIMPYSEEY